MKVYCVVFEKTEGGYSAYVPDFPGCVACGGTMEETERLMQEAIELYIEEMKAAGEPIPEPTTKAGSIHVAA